MNNRKPLIVVVNGAADEGYWTVNYLLDSGLFRVRTTVRRMHGHRVVRLQKLGTPEDRCEIVAAATDNEEALSRAFQDAHGIYGTSIYNIHAKQYRSANPEEMAQCRALLKAARRCSTLQHFVWQTMTRFDLPPETLKLDAPIHFRTKWYFEDIIKDSDLPWTMVRQPAYMRQMAFGMQYGNRLVYPYAPDSRLPYVAEKDIGKIVAAVFSDRDRHLHQTINAVSEVVTPVELAERAHRFRPEFSPRYRQATWVENAFFEQIIVRLRPAFRYPMQINRNIMQGNYFGMTLEDKAVCARLIEPLKLSTLEDWFEERFN